MRDELHAALVELHKEALAVDRPDLADDVDVVRSIVEGICKGIDKTRHRHDEHTYSPDGGKGPDT
jgi:hypothetical protein